MKKQPVKFYQAIQQMNVEEMAEHHALFLKNSGKEFRDMDIKQLTQTCKEWLLSDVKE